MRPLTPTLSPQARLCEKSAARRRRRRVFSTVVLGGAACYLCIWKCNLEELCSLLFARARLFTQPEAGRGSAAFAAPLSINSEKFIPWHLHQTSKAPFDAFTANSARRTRRPFPLAGGDRRRPGGCVGRRAECTHRRPAV